MFAAVPLANITMDEGRAEMVPSFQLDHGFRDIDACDLESDIQQRLDNSAAAAAPDIQAFPLLAS
jgi:hypothetical protein